VATFVDRALVEFIDATAMTTLLTGGAAGPYPQLNRVVQSVYSTDSVTVSAISGVSTLSVTPIVRYEVVEAISITHTASHPSFAQSDLRGSRRISADAAYADLVADLALDVVVTQDPGGIDAVTIDPMEDITSFADFQQRFRYLDLDSFLAEHKITTVEELRSRYDYLLAEVHFRAPTTEESTPATVAVEVPLACVLSEDLDLAPALRAATGLRAAIDAAGSGRTDPLFGPPIHAAAVAVVFPQGPLGAGTPTAGQIDAVCAGAQVLPLFASPP
jgi:hypothetical protein